MFRLLTALVAALALIVQAVASPAASGIAAPVLLALVGAVY